MPGSIWANCALGNGLIVSVFELVGVRGGRVYLDSTSSFSLSWAIPRFGPCDPAVGALAFDPIKNAPVAACSVLEDETWDFLIVLFAEARFLGRTSSLGSSFILTFLIVK